MHSHKVVFYVKNCFNQHPAARSSKSGSTWTVYEAGGQKLDPLWSWRAEPGQKLGWNSTQNRAKMPFFIHHFRYNVGSLGCSKVGIATEVNWQLQDGVLVLSVIACISASACGVLVSDFYLEAKTLQGTLVTSARTQVPLEPKLYFTGQDKDSKHHHRSSNFERGNILGTLLYFEFATWSAS